jgi:chromosome segregation ATPase
MAKVGAQRAAELTGVSKSTIQRAMNIGKLSYEIDANDRRIIDVSELERVFGLSIQKGQGNAAISQPAEAQTELQRAADLLEIERLKMRVRALEDQLEMTREQLEDMRGQRDLWQRQSQQILITSQYSQKQAEDLKEELRQRDERARQQKQKILEEKMKRLHGQNENIPAETAGKSAKPAPQRMDIQGLWNKIRGKAA